MHTDSIKSWAHDHTFGQDTRRPGERRTLIVIGITATMMVIEIAAGAAFGSMALLADGLHMASHASALTITAFAYYFTRRHASDKRFSFGTGKINSLGGFAGAVLLVVFALIMAGESVGRLLNPVPIGFNAAIAVAVLGLLVNGACLLILGHDHDHEEHEDTEEGEHHHHARHDHNLWSAYLHVLADALTSLLAIFALLAGKYYGLNWLDPVMGLVGAALVTRWSIGLIKATTAVLLDMQAPAEVREAVREAIEKDGDSRVSDLHVWSVGPGVYAVEIGVVASNLVDAGHYRALLPRKWKFVHTTVSVHACQSKTAASADC